MYYYNGNSGLTYYSYSYYDSHSKQKFSKDVVVNGSLDGYSPASQCPNGCLINGKCGSKDECETANFVVLIVFCVIGGIIVIAVVGICLTAALGKKGRVNENGMNNAQAPLLAPPGTSFNTLGQRTIGDMENDSNSSDGFKKGFGRKNKFEDREGGIHKQSNLQMQ